MSKYAVIDGHKLDCASFREVLKYQKDDAWKALLTKNVDELSDIEKLVLKSEYETGNKDRIKEYIENQFNTKELTYAELLGMPAQERKEMAVGIAKVMQQIDVNLGKDISYKPIPIGENLTLQVLPIDKTIEALSQRQNEIKVAKCTVGEKCKKKEISEEESGWLQSILDIFNVLSEYVIKSLKQAESGNFIQDVSVSEKGGLIVLGLLDANFSLDIRDIIDDFVKQKGGQRLFELINFISGVSLIGVLKDADKAYINLGSIWRQVGNSYNDMKAFLNSMDSDQVKTIFKNISKTTSKMSKKVEDLLDNAKEFSRFLGEIVTKIREGMVYSADYDLSKLKPEDVTREIAEWLIANPVNVYATQHPQLVTGVDLRGLFYAGGFVMDDDGVYHARQEWSLQSFEYSGYNDFYDTVFHYATSMKPAVFQFTYDEQDYRLWAWKGDYLNLGAGAEMGIYKRMVIDETPIDQVNGTKTEHWLVDQSLAMPMTLTLDYNRKPIISYDPKKDDPQIIDPLRKSTDKWWVTGFNPDYQDVKASELTATYIVDFSNDKGMYNAFINSDAFKGDKRWSISPNDKNTLVFTF